ncbi:methylated-DNA--[protein]-cysteine S-methyltransferase [Rubinisphaera margarita]|uniref:methylated-DNA--[protein]-cysteine S-methyltransferase n=1 Tax=Rubinisphaera margarita TaxID=2909586 RepID=UPI001EE7B72A|nr:methylated-DNA--[protein]-cysteine S-methyltransferase [Rubinisphaera margarita]MCG6156061.1 methylated-DNA--[protein]-cysteine S-methyltransferase [Rubinisphaera margarita]
MSDQELYLSAFPTTFGWCGIIGRDRCLRRVLIGGRDRDEILLKASDTTTSSEDWFAECRESIQRYAAGEFVDFSGFEIDLTPFTPFQTQVLKRVRQVAYGRTASYGQIATRCGRPGAARAVGGAMSRNPIPLIIPCHRVIGSSGRLTGFSAPRGLDLKQQLLDLEQRTLFSGH